MNVRTPTLDRRSAVMEESHAIGRFLDWLSVQGIHLARYERVEDLRDEWLMSIHEGPSDLLHRYFDIDPAEEDRELRAILAAAVEEESRVARADAPGPLRAAGAPSEGARLG